MFASSSVPCRIVQVSQIAKNFQSTKTEPQPLVWQTCSLPIYPAFSGRMKRIQVTWGRMVIRPVAVECGTGRVIGRVAVAPAITAVMVAGMTLPIGWKAVVPVPAISTWMTCLEVGFLSEMYTEGRYQAAAATLDKFANQT